MDSVLIILGKLIIQSVKIFNLGYGSTWPGHIALLINKNFIAEQLSKNSHLKIVLITGTNGKTTTAKLIKFILGKNGLKVFHNEAGANLLNGVASTLIQYSSLLGKIPYDVAIFEIDENTLPLFLEKIEPYAVVILNLFRDQLDRYGEVNTIAKTWQNSLQNAPKNTLLFINGDDPQLSYIGQNSDLKTYFFGINEKHMIKRDIPHDVDFLYCPTCRTRLIFEKISYSHMGEFSCPKCGFKRIGIRTFPDLPNPFFGTYNIYNINAAAFVANKAFNISIDRIRKHLSEFEPAFGRQEELKYKGKKIIVLLSKNPTSFNQSIQAMQNLRNDISNEKKVNVLLVLNDRIPDGRDVSWIWDVEFEELVKHARHITISGDRCYDMALRIKYTQKSQNKIQNTKYQIHENLKEAVESVVNKTKTDQTLFILPTYSAMLEVRKILTGKSIL